MERLNTLCLSDNILFWKIVSDRCWLKLWTFWYSGSTVSCPLSCIFLRLLSLQSYLSQSLDSPTKPLPSICLCLRAHLCMDWIQDQLTPCSCRLISFPSGAISQQNSTVPPDKALNSLLELQEYLEESKM